MDPGFLADCCRIHSTVNVGSLPWLPSLLAFLFCCASLRGALFFSSFFRVCLSAGWLWSVWVQILCLASLGLTELLGSAHCFPSCQGGFGHDLFPCFPFPFLFSPYGMPVTPLLLYLMLLYGSLRLCSFFILSSFCSSHWLLSTALSSSSDSYLLSSWVYYVVPRVNFSFVIILYNSRISKLW